MLKQSFIYSIWLYARTAILAISTLYLAKVSSISDYGNYISAIAIIGFFVPLVHGGMAYVYLDSAALLKTSKSECEKYWKIALFLTSLFSGLIVYSALEIFTNSNLSFLMTILLAISEIWLLGIYEIESRKEQSLENSFGMGFWQAVPHAARLVFFILAIKYFKPQNYINTWIVSSILACVLFLIFTKRNKYEPLCLRTLWEFCKKSANYGIGGASLKIMYEIDKPILSSISSNSSTAQLSISQRFIDLASIPMNSLISISLVKILNSNSRNEKLKIFNKAIVSGIMVSALTVGIVLVISPYIISFLGTRYSYSKDLLILLAWSPAAILLRGMLGNWLATSGVPNLYAKYNFIGALARAVTCIPLIFYFDIYGALASLLVSEIIVISLMFMFFLKYRRDENGI